MRISFWDVLSIFLLLGLAGAVVWMLAIFSNPNNILNPFPPPTQPVLISLPTDTPEPFAFPPTWTATVAVIPPTRTPEPVDMATITPTLYVIPSFTPTYTPTPTITLTPTETPED